MEPGRAESDAWSVLVVEDDSLIRTTTAEYLRAVGYNVIEATTAEEAVAVLSSGVKVHLIFSDVYLPGDMGGFSLAVWVRNNLRSIPIVLTSGIESAVRPLDRQTLVPFLAKPYRMEDAERLVASVPQGRHSRSSDLASFRSSYAAPDAFDRSCRPRTDFVETTRRPTA